MLQIIVYKVLKRINDLAVKNILKLRNFESSEAIIIFSEARGGSTWLMELLQNNFFLVNSI